MTVSNLMKTDIVSVLPSDSLSYAARLLRQHSVGALPVCDEKGSLCGILTDRDIITRGVSYDMNTAKCTVDSIMTTGVVTVSPETSVRDAATIMAKEKIRRMPVVQNNSLVGMLALGDIALSHGFDMEVSKAISEISERDFSVHPLS